MAITQTHANNQIVKWRKSVFREFRRGNYFSPYMGESPTSIIQVSHELKDGGDILNITLIGSLRGPGVSTGPLVGNEEKLDNYGMRLWVDWARNAVLLTKAQMRKSSFEQLELVRPLLTEWGNVLIRDELIQAFLALPTESPPVNLGNEATGGQRINGILYANATLAEKHAWHDANFDRILYGVETGNFAAGSHTTSLSNIATTERASAAGILLAKRIARRASPGITPYRDNEDQGREYFVLFAGAEAFRDLAADPAIVAANKDARPREGGGVDKNPLFQDGDLIYRGVIIREVPEISDYATLPTAGGSSGQVQAMFLCGQSAAVIGWGQMPKPTERKEDDYGFIIGRGVEMVFGVGKVFKKRSDGSTQLIQYGMVTIWVAAPADT